ncbi:Chromosome partition protein Smc [Carpediemonas membranifera]|uniref:Chromosome partition protein Smc n=1 Tax=Carpediemonas membranifera TaxID=201153 RepID=A0A8J6AY00_9EUKA|nr:Chromosome partition protein Smc [Carpediemonas membranifera]|eukprot:KAG9391188.1 Chromosome partition protein Smc [Carpediemonas membranifera]
MDERTFIVPHGTFKDFKSITDKHGLASYGVVSGRGQDGHPTAVICQLSEIDNAMSSITDANVAPYAFTFAAQADISAAVPLPGKMSLEEAVDAITAGNAIISDAQHHAKSVQRPKAAVPSKPVSRPASKPAAAKGKVATKTAKPAIKKTAKKKSAQSSMAMFIKNRSPEEQKRLFGLISRNKQIIGEFEQITEAAKHNSHRARHYAKDEVESSVKQLADLKESYRLMLKASELSGDAPIADSKEMHEERRKAIELEGILEIEQLDTEISTLTKDSTSLTDVEKAASSALSAVEKEIAALSAEIADSEARYQRVVEELCRRVGVGRVKAALPQLMPQKGGRA